jgi:hypothetical protein
MDLSLSRRDAERFRPLRPGIDPAMVETHDAILVGGPRDGNRLDSGGQPVAEVEIDGLMHRYVITTKERDGRRVYNYDGVVDPAGAEPGAESPESGHHSPVSGDRLSD